MPPNDTIDTAERLVRLETKLDFIIKSMDSLPPSPACVTKHLETDHRLTALERWQNIVIGGLAIANMVLLFFSDKIKGLL